MTIEEGDSQDHQDDFPLNSVLIAGVALAIGTIMSIFFTVSGDLGMTSFMAMFAASLVISIAAWRLIEFVKSAGKGTDSRQQ